MTTLTAVYGYDRTPYRVGDRVIHYRGGEGTVLALHDRMIGQVEVRMDDGRVVETGPNAFRLRGADAAERRMRRPTLIEREG